jgi:hypothetical protein
MQQTHQHGLVKRSGSLSPQPSVASYFEGLGWNAPNQPLCALPLNVKVPRRHAQPHHAKPGWNCGGDQAESFNKFKPFVIQE